jgi:hypothetical protein
VAAPIPDAVPVTQIVPMIAPQFKIRF